MGGCDSRDWSPFPLWANQVASASGSHLSILSVPICEADSLRVHPRATVRTPGHPCVLGLSCLSLSLLRLLLLIWWWDMSPQPLLGDLLLSPHA